MANGYIPAAVERGCDPCSQVNVENKAYLGGVLGIDVNGERQPISEGGIVDLTFIEEETREAAEQAIASAQAAAESEQTASEAAASARSSESAAQTAANAAEAAKDDAEDAASSANASKNTADSYATAAQTAAAQAQIADGNAERSAEFAIAAAAQAASSAGNALSSANDAYTSASTAQAAAEAAQTAQAAAEASEATASTAATTATQAKEAAQTAQTAAEAAKSAAAQSATAASGSATAAAGSATQAAASATAADASADAARAVLDSIPADYSALSADVDDLKNTFNNIIDYKRVTPTSAPDNYRLKNDGNCVSNQLYRMLKYPVTAGQKVYVNVTIGGTETNDRALQFQDREAVTTTGNTSHVVGTPIDESFSGYLIVPTGAKYLILSVLKTDSASGVYSNKVDEMRSDIDTSATNIEYVSDFACIIAGNTRIDPTSVSNGWELNTEGVSNTNSNMRILKYEVTAGEKIAIIAKKVASAVYQFQNSATVPGASETPRTRVGETITEATAAFVTVPDGATYVIINDEPNGKNGLYVFGQVINPIINSEVGRVNLIAHKGGNQAHDGTFARLTYSAEHGYKILEVDVAFTSDGVAVVQHDSTITVGGTTYTIASETYATLSALDLGDGEHLITLDDAVLFCKKRGLVVEIDLSNVSISATKAATIMGIVIDRGMLGSAIITGTAEKQTYITAITKEAILSVSSLYDTVDEEAVDAIAGMIPSALRVICSINHSNVTEAIVDYAHRKGLIVKTWTHTSTATVNDDLSIGVDLAICDNGIYPDSFVITN